VRGEIGCVFEWEVEHVGICLEFYYCCDGGVRGGRDVSGEEPLIAGNDAEETKKDTDVG
jgi:hypothetical protein